MQLHCDCGAWFDPRAPKVKLCIRCEAYWTLLSLKTEGLCYPQRVLPFPLFSSSSRRRRARRFDHSGGGGRRHGDLPLADQEVVAWKLAREHSSS